MKGGLYSDEAAFCALVSKRWQEIADNDQSYKEQYERDSPELTYRSYAKKPMHEDEEKLALGMMND